MLFLASGETSLRTGKYFECIIKQLLNSAFVRDEEFYRSRRVLSTDSMQTNGRRIPTAKRGKEIKQR